MNKNLEFSCNIIPCNYGHFHPNNSTITKKLSISKFNVEIAVTPEQQYIGLSYRKFLPSECGMLFIFPEPQILSFCMRHCFISLDIAFISSELYIINTCTMSLEQFGHEEKIYYSKQPSKFALEVNGGVFNKLGVKQGDLIRFSENLSLKYLK